MQHAGFPRDLPAAMHAAIAQARAAWPDFTVDEATFLAYLQARLGQGEKELATAVQSLHLADLYCACACAAGLPRALAAFEEHYLATASQTLARIDGDPEFVTEVKQQLRCKILLSVAGQPPRIAEYEGRAPLHSWVRVALLRLALNSKRDRKRDRYTTAEPLTEVSCILADAELGLIKNEYRERLKQALAAALAALDRRERNLLRLHLIEGLNIDRLGVIYKVHRATIARWMAQTRQTLAEQTRRYLVEQSGIDDAELDALVGLAKSQIDLSLSRLLQDSGPGSG